MGRKGKGLNTFLSAAFMVLIVVAVSMIVFAWVNTLSKSQTEKVRDTTSEQLGCQFADMYIRGATYNCSDNCLPGNIHNLSVIVRNNGKRTLEIQGISVRNTTGNMFNLDVPVTSVGVGEDRELVNISTGSCMGINNTIDEIVVSSINCPGTAFDSLDGRNVQYLSC